MNDQAIDPSNPNSAAAPDPNTSTPPVPPAITEPTATPAPAPVDPLVTPVNAAPEPVLPTLNASQPVATPTDPLLNPLVSVTGNPAPTTPAEPENPSSAGGATVTSVLWAFVLGVFNWLLVPLAIVLILHFFVFQAFHVVGHSMIPTLEQNDYLIISKVDASLSHLSRLWGKSGQYIPKRDQVIVFRYPGNPSQIFVKRVIGLPGEHVVVKGGHVTVSNSTHPNGFNPDEGHQVADPITLGDVDEIVQPGKVFVMGDNRTPGGSFDSRDWGELPSDNIIGQAILRLLPFDRFKILGTS